MCVCVCKNKGKATLTCGVKAKTRSCKEYSLLVLKIPTSRDLRPDSPSFLFRPRKNCKCLSVLYCCKHNYNSPFMLNKLLINIHVSWLILHICLNCIKNCVLRALSFLFEEIWHIHIYKQWQHGLCSRTQCNSLGLYQGFRESYCLHLSILITALSSETYITKR